MQLLTNLFQKKYSVYELTHLWCHENEVPHTAEKQGISTNDTAKEEAFSTSNALQLYVLDEQTKGRGRGNNQWLNGPSGDALTISFSLEMLRPPQPIATPLIGLAVAKALNKSFHLPNLSLKAPNDIYLKDKKVAGILVEVAQMGEKFRLIIGLGLNVFSAPDEISNAGCLAQEHRPRKKTWFKFLDQLQTEVRLASQESMGSHLSGSQRKELLKLLNKNPILTEKYLSISPFGDLSTNTKVISWRDL